MVAASRKRKSQSASQSAQDLRQNRDGTGPSGLGSASASANRALCDGEAKHKRTHARTHAHTYPDSGALAGYLEPEDPDAVVDLIDLPDDDRVERLERPGRGLSAIE